MQLLHAAADWGSASVIKVLRAKLHGIRVTSADLDYHGSITLDPEHCEAAGIYPLEFVDIWNKNWRGLAPTSSLETAVRAAAF